MLRILVACKRVVDHAIKVRPTSDNLKIATTNLKHGINPFDEIALEEALKIKEFLSLSTKSSETIINTTTITNITNITTSATTATNTNQHYNNGSEIIAISIGGKSSGDLLRTALAMGADRAIHINLPEAEGVYGNGSSNSLIAKCISLIAKREKIDLVLLGKQAIDDDSGQVGPLCAAYLDWPQATFASKIIIDKNDCKRNIQVHREVDNGIQRVQFNLPAIITTDLRLNIPRYATLQNIMKAKSKPIKVETLESLNLTLNDNSLSSNPNSNSPPSPQLERIEEPKKRGSSAMILNSVDDLLMKLKENGLIKK